MYLSDDNIDRWLFYLYKSLTTELPEITAIALDNSISQKMNFSVTRHGSSIISAIEHRMFKRPSLTRSMLMDLDKWVKSSGEYRSTRLVKLAIICKILNQHLL